MKAIKTGPDLLIEFVEKKEKVPILEASKELKIPKEQVTSWAEVLSGKGIIGLNYPLTGGGILTKSGVVLTGKENPNKEMKTVDDLVFLMKEHTFLKFDNVVKKLSVDPNTVRKWISELVKEDVVETETFFFGDIGLIRSDNFAAKLAEVEKRKKDAVRK